MAQIRKKNLMKSKKNRGKTIFYWSVLAFPLLQFAIFYIGVNLNSFALAFQKFNMDGDGLETEDYYVICETQGSETEGQTIFDYSGRFGKQPNVSLVVKMDREKYHSLIRNALARFE